MPAVPERPIHSTARARARHRWAVSAAVWAAPMLALSGPGAPPTHAQPSPAAESTDAGQPGPEWVEQDGSFIELQLDGEPLWRFNFDQDHTHNYFHPLRLPGLGDLTLDMPGDHVHHHGLWFSWKYINAVNFWEHAPGADRPAGTTSWRPPALELRQNGAAAFSMVISYAINNQQVLAENRTIEVSPPASDGAYTIDWHSRFDATAETVTLDRTPLPDEPGGKVYGGYAGLSARLSQWADRTATTLAAPAEFNSDNRYRGRSEAFEYSGELAGKPIGITILAHPDNLNSPSPWYAIRTSVMSFFTPAVLCYGPHQIHKGEGFQLRYRVIVHPSRWSVEQLQDAHDAFVKEHTAAAPAIKPDQTGAHDE